MVLVPEILGLGHGPFPRGTHGLVGKIGQLDITIGMESEVHGTIGTACHSQDQRQWHPELAANAEPGPHPGLTQASESKPAFQQALQVIRVHVQV